MKIRYKLLIFLIIIAAVPLFISLIISYYSIQDKIENSFIDTNKTQVDQTTHAIQLSFEDLDRKLLSIYKAPDFYKFLLNSDNTNYEWVDEQKKTTNLLFVLAQSMNRKCNIYLYNDNFKNLYLVDGKSLNLDIQNNVSEKNQVWITDSFLNKGEFTITKILSDPSSANSRIAIMSRSVADVLTQKNMGVLAIEIDQDFIKTAIGEDFSKEYIQISDINGDIMYQTTDSIKNLDQYLAVKSIKNSYGWQVIKYIPKSMLREIAWDTINPILFSGAIFLLVGIALSLIISWQISKPITKLTDNIIKASNGDFTVYNDKIKKNSQNEIDIMSVRFNQMLIKIDELIKNEYKLKINEYSARMEAVQAQINPHFLYNTLMTIYSEAMDIGSDSICIMVKKLSSIFRYSIEGDKNIVSLSDEIENTRNYLEIQKYRYEDKLLYSFDIPEDYLRLPAIKLSIQPIVENAIIHGIAPKGEGLIRIHAENDEEQIRIIIEDNGVGISPERIHFIMDKLQMEDGVKEHIGIYNVHKRIIYTFSGSKGISIVSEEGKGTIVTISWKVTANG